MDQKTIQVGLIGLGRAGSGMHLPEMQSTKGKFDVVAACDIDPARQKIFEDLLGHSVRFYTKAEDLVKDSGIELVSVASPSNFHTEHAILGLEAGKYVFIEKPIARSVAESLKLAAASKAHPGKLFLRHNAHFAQDTVEMTEVAKSGILGDIFEIRLRNQSWNRRADWQTLLDCAGGLLNNHGPHMIEHAIEFMDAPVVRIFSKLRRIAALGDAEDHFNLILEGANGRIVDIEVSGGCALSEAPCTFYGTRGAMRFEDGKLHLRYIDPAYKFLPLSASRKSPPVSGTFGNVEELPWIEKEYPLSNPSRGEHIWNHLYDSIREGKEFPISLERGLEVVRITEEAKKGTGFEAKA